MHLIFLHRNLHSNQDQFLSLLQFCVEHARSSALQDHFTLIQIPVRYHRFSLWWYYLCTRNVCIIIGTVRHMKIYDTSPHFYEVVKWGICIESTKIHLTLKGQRHKYNTFTASSMNSTMVIDTNTRNDFLVLQPW